MSWVYDCIASWTIRFDHINLINHPFILLFARFARKRKNLRRFPKRWLRFSISYHSFIKRITLKRNNRYDPTEEKIFFPRNASRSYVPSIPHILGQSRRENFCVDLSSCVRCSFELRLAENRVDVLEKRGKKERGGTMLFFNLNPVFSLLIKRVSKKILKFIKFLSNIPLKKEGGGGKLDLCFNTFGIPTFLSKYLKREINLY